MQNTILWFIGAAALIALTYFIFKTMLQRPAPKNESTKPLFTQETAEEIAPVHIDYPQQSPKEPELNLPQFYGADRMVLMVRDPDWLYAYWEITATKQDEFLQDYGPQAWHDSQPVLRVYDVTGVTNFNGENANNYMDITLNNDTDSWHINVGRPNHSFCVDFGRKFTDGRFVTILRSNIAWTPRAGLSDCLDEEWMWLEDIYSYMGKWQYGLSSPMLVDKYGPEGGIVPLGVSSPGFVDKNNTN